MNFRNLAIGASFIAFAGLEAVVAACTPISGPTPNIMQLPSNIVTPPAIVREIPEVTTEYRLVPSPTPFPTATPQQTAEPTYRPEQYRSPTALSTEEQHSAEQESCLEPIYQAEKRIQTLNSILDSFDSSSETETIITRESVIETEKNLNEYVVGVGIWNENGPSITHGLRISTDYVISVSHGIRALNVQKLGFNMEVYELTGNVLHPKRAQWYPNENKPDISLLYLGTDISEPYGIKFRTGPLKQGEYVQMLSVDLSLPLLIKSALGYVVFPDTNSTTFSTSVIAFPGDSGAPMTDADENVIGLQIGIYDKQDERPKWGASAVIKIRYFIPLIEDEIEYLQRCDINVLTPSK